MQQELVGKNSFKNTRNLQQMNTECVGMLLEQLTSSWFVPSRPKSSDLVTLFHPAQSELHNCVFPSPLNIIVTFPTLGSSKHHKFFLFLLLGLRYTSNLSGIPFNTRMATQSAFQRDSVWPSCNYLCMLLLEQAISLWCGLETKNAFLMCFWDTENPKPSERDASCLSWSLSFSNINSGLVWHSISDFKPGFHQMVARLDNQLLFSVVPTFVSSQVPCSLYHSLSVLSIVDGPSD